MTGQNFASLIRKYTRTNSTTLPDSDIVLFGNVAKDDMAAMVLEAKEDAFVVPATTNLIDDQREYPFPTDILGSMSKLEAKFVVGGNYIELDEISFEAKDVPHNEADIIAEYANEKGKAFYDLRRNSIYLYSGTIVEVTAGLKLWFSAFPQDISAASLSLSTDLSLSATTTDVTLPRMFHELWARKTSMLWKQSKEKPIPLSERELKFDVDMEEKLSNYKMANTDRVVQALLPSDTHLQI